MKSTHPSFRARKFPLPPPKSQSNNTHKIKTTTTTTKKKKKISLSLSFVCVTISGAIILREAFVMFCYVYIPKQSIEAVVSFLADWLFLRQIEPADSHER